MIGKLTGRLENVSGSVALIDVNGVGYLVTCSARTLRAMPPLGMAVSVLVETQVREDAISLFGFADAAERDWFRLLTTVQGVGARVAQALLSALSPEQLTQAIALQDKTMLTQADGVGPKLAARLLTELKDKVGTLAAEPLRGAPALAAVGDSVTADALSALLNLGYRRAEAFQALQQARQAAPEAGLDRLLPAALRLLGSQAA